MKLLITFFFLSFFISSYAQSTYEADFFAQAEIAENVLFGPEYLDYRRVAKTKFLSYQNTTDSIAYYYPFDTSSLYTVRNTYSLVDGNYDYTAIDSFFFDQDSEWNLIKQYEKNEEGIFELKSILKRRYQKNMTDTTVLEQFDMPTSEWVITKRTLYERFANGDIKKITYENWNKEMSVWEFRKFNLYNEDRLTLEHKSKFSWSIYEWDDMGRPISSLNKEYDVDSDMYFNLEFTEYKWINNTEQWGLAYDWDPILANWVFKRKIVRNYNSDDLLDKVLILDSIGVNDYVGKWKSNFTYDTFGHKTLVLNYSWANSAWKLASKNVKEYDPQEYLVLERTYSWDTELNDLKLRREVRNYFEEYENGLVSIQNFSKIPTKLYPNPAADRIYFDIANPTLKFTITIYSSLGQSVLAQKGSNGTNINISQLPAGQYFYILKGDGFGSSGSFLKE